jgi:hypothetical protein
MRMIAELLQGDTGSDPNEQATDSLECPPGLVGRVIGRAPHQGLTLVPIAAHLDFFCPPWNPASLMNVFWSCSKLSSDVNECKSLRHTPSRTVRSHCASVLTWTLPSDTGFSWRGLRVKVALVIGKGGETIKGLKAGAYTRPHLCST